MGDIQSAGEWILLTPEFETWSQSGNATSKSLVGARTTTNVCVCMNGCIHLSFKTMYVYLYVRNSFKQKYITCRHLFQRTLWNIYFDSNDENKAVQAITFRAWRSLR